MNFDNPRITEPILGVWNIEKFVGQGQYGKVYKGFNNRGETAAIKIISLPNEDIKRSCEDLYGSQDGLEEYMTEIVQKFTNEVQSMKMLRAESRNIISIKDNRAIQTGMYWDIIIIMEYAAPLKTCMNSKGMRIRDAISLGKGVAGALDVCARHNIIHRDIKEDNIFYGHDGQYKVGDFGVANMAASRDHHTMGIGTRNYMAPEVSTGTEYDTRVDIYSLGIVLYKIFNNGRLPFVNANVKGSEATRKRLNGEPLPPPENAPESIARIILKCCEFNPKNRYAAAAELVNALERAERDMSEAELDRDILSPKERTEKRAIFTNNQTQTGNQTQSSGESVISKTHGSGTTEGMWTTYNPATSNGYDRNTGRNGANTTSGSTMKMQRENSYDEEEYLNKTVDIVQRLIKERGANSPEVMKIIEKNRKLEEEIWRRVNLEKKNKKKKYIICILAGVAFAALLCVLLVIVFSTSYFANESDYHRIYSRSIISGEKLFYGTSAAYVSEDDGYLYFSEIAMEDTEVSTYNLCRINIKTKEKEVINDGNCHFDVVIGDYIYFTSGIEGQEYLYRMPKNGTGTAEMLLDANCYDLKADGKTLVFNVLDMGGQERKINTNKISTDEGN